MLEPDAAGRVLLDPGRRNDQRVGLQLTAAIRGVRAQGWWIHQKATKKGVTFFVMYHS